MSGKPKLTDDPFAHLPRRPLFGETKIQPETKIEAETKSEIPTGSVARGQAGVAGECPEAPPKEVKRRKPTFGEQRQNSKRGRPAAVGQPWVAAGMSRAAWYRKRADARA